MNQTSYEIAKTAFQCEDFSKLWVEKPRANQGALPHWSLQSVGDVIRTWGEQLERKIIRTQRPDWREAFFRELVGKIEFIFTRKSSLSSDYALFSWCDICVTLVWYCCNIYNFKRPALSYQIEQSYFESNFNNDDNAYTLDGGYYTRTISETDTGLVLSWDDDTDDLILSYTITPNNDGFGIGGDEFVR